MQIKKIDSRIFLVTALFCLAIIWLVVRFYNLQQSYFFMGDAGRDAWVMWKWQNLGKIPILGPGVSALPMNVSPIYFYMLYPFYLVSGGNYFYSQITLLVYCWFFIVVTGWLIIDKKEQHWSYCLLVLLLTFSPQFIIQSRFVWNPSFIIAPLVTAFYLLKNALKLENKFKIKLVIYLVVSGILVALATSLNMSVIPGAIAFLVITIILFKRRFLYWFLGLISGMLFFYLPMILFELKYSFQISKRMMATIINGGMASIREPMMIRLEKIIDFSVNSLWLGVVILLFLIGFCGYKFIKSKTTEERKKLIKSNLFLATIGLLITIFFSLIIPFNIEAHYIFCVLFFMLIGLVNLPQPINSISSLLIVFYWIFLLVVSPLDKQVFRTVAELDICMNQISKKINEPVYVAVQSGVHLLHDGKEFWYGLAKQGVQVEEIYDGADKANLLVVINELATFTDGVDKFHELTLFGPAEVIERGECSQDWGWTILKKID